MKCCTSDENFKNCTYKQCRHIETKNKERIEPSAMADLYSHHSSSPFDGDLTIVYMCHPPLLIFNRVVLRKGAQLLSDALHCRSLSIINIWASVCSRRNLLDEEVHPCLRITQPLTREPNTYLHLSPRLRSRRYTINEPKRCIVPT